MLIIGGMVLIKGGMKSRCSWDSVLTLRSDEKLSGGFLRFCTLYQVRVQVQLKVKNKDCIFKPPEAEVQAFDCHLRAL